MVDARPYRHPRRGIVLISTLISLMLVIGLTLLLQSQALNNVKVVKRLTSEMRRDVLADGVRELMRPLVLEAMIEFDTPQTLPLDGTELRVEFWSERFAVYLSTRASPGQQPKTVEVSIESRVES